MQRGPSALPRSERGSLPSRADDSIISPVVKAGGDTGNGQKRSDPGVPLGEESGRENHERSQDENIHQPDLLGFYDGVGRKEWGVHQNFPLW
jgi:hypothetical protein